QPSAFRTLSLHDALPIYGADTGWDTLNLVSSLGGFIQAIGFGIFILDVILHARKGDLAPRNPWRAGTLEWAMPLPPPSYNFASIDRKSTRLNSSHVKISY